jgi:hypothetical protein
MIKTIKGTPYYYAEIDPTSKNYNPTEDAK